MNERKKFVEHLAKIFFKQNNQEYRNFLIGILRMENFKDWDNILIECSYDNFFFTELPCITYDYRKYGERIKEYCKQELNMSDTDFFRDDYNAFMIASARDKYNTTSEEVSPIDKTINRQNDNHKDINTEWISQNLDLVLSKELPDYSQESIEEIKSIALELQNINSSTLKNINFRILQEQYLKIFTKEQIAQIVSYPVIQDAILSLDDNKIECLDVVVNDYIKREKFLFRHDEEFQVEGTEPSQWSQMTEKYLVSLVSNQYTQIIAEIGQVEDDNQRKELYKKLGYIMIDPNVYEIKTINQLENYEEIQREVAKKIIYDGDISNYPQLENMDEVSRKRFAIMQRYGISSGLELSKMFDDDVRQLPVEEGSSDEKQIEYLLAIKELYKIDNPESFREIFELLEEANVPYIPQEYSNQKILEKKLKLLYEKTYNKALTKIENLDEISDERREQLGLADYEGRVYEVEDDFNLIVTSVSPYADSYREIKNFLQDWKRRDLKSQLGCFSNITSERFRTASVPFTLLGFDKLQGIDMQAPIDNESEAMAMTPFCECNWFTLPGNSGIGKFNTITEIDAERIMPSYIPVQKKNGTLVQVENAKIAAKQFGEARDSGDKLPLVIIDEDKLLYKQLTKILMLIQQYRANPRKELLREISGNLGTEDYIPGFFGMDPLEGNVIDLVSQDFSNTEKFVTTCELSKLVEYINNLPYAQETKKVELSDISEETLLELYHEVPSVGKKSAFQAIKDTLNQEYAKENSEKAKEKDGGERS